MGEIETLETRVGQENINDDPKLSDIILAFYKKRSFFFPAVATFLALGISSFNIVGRALGLIDQSGNITFIGVSVVVIFVILSIINTCIIAAYNKKEDNAIKENAKAVNSLKAYLKVEKEILTSVREVNESKLYLCRAYINNNFNNTNACITACVTDPRKQIEKILNEIRNYLSRISNIDKENIGVSLAYKTVFSPEWDWLYDCNTSGDTSINELLENQNSALFNVMKNGKTIFHVKKKNAIEKGEYYPSKKDLYFKSEGTIICMDVSLKKGIYDAILSITTYGRDICHDNESEKKQVIYDIIPHFETALKLELALDFIQNKRIMKQKPI